MVAVCSLPECVVCDFGVCVCYCGVCGWKVAFNGWLLGVCRLLFAECLVSGLFLIDYVWLF